VFGIALLYDLSSNTFLVFKAFLCSPVALLLNDTSCQRGPRNPGFYLGFIYHEAQTMLFVHLQYS
jgi:hypothetical protein